MPDCTEIEQEEIERGALRIMLQREQYYSDMRVRIPLYSFMCKWKDLSAEKKYEYGQQRAADHNKFGRHIASYEENILVLRDYIRFLELKGIKAVFIIPPFTDAYNKFVSKEIKEAVLDMVNGIDHKIDFIDYNKTGYFEDDDFIDTDHLNGRGAYKMSMLLANKYEL